MGEQAPEKPDQTDEQIGPDSPHLDEQQQEQAASRATIGPLVIHEVVRAQGVEELERSTRGLVWSGLAAGLSIGFSFLADATIMAALPDRPWRPLISSFGYSIGFLIVVLGQQQLFTETTLTALIPALTENTLASYRRAARVWGLVLCANILPTLLWGWVAARSELFPHATIMAMRELSDASMAHGFWQTMGLAALAGWLIGLMVWILPASGSAKPFMVILLTYLVAMFGFPHIIAGSAEAFFDVMMGNATIGDFLGRFFIPTLIGNMVGGTVLAAMFNHAQIKDELKESTPDKCRR
ncbi:formate/nitrite transporter family protein [Kozakia baliensis]|uniref:formate/nitrite transporter family protein n=1 Tax=Kozakia baliensis TaxID=153496 RepID=UPI00345B7651